jgi:hypothetical protein
LPVILNLCLLRISHKKKSLYPVGLSCVVIKNKEKATLAAFSNGVTCFRVA